MPSYYFAMHNLRGAIGKDDELNLGKPMPSASIRTHRNNDSQSMWSVGVGSDDEESQDISIREIDRMQKLIDKISDYKTQGLPANEETLKELIRSHEQYLASYRTQKQKTEEFEKKLSQLLVKAPSELQPYISKLLQTAKQLRKKLKVQTHTAAKQFDQITEKLFKKPVTKTGNKDGKKKILQINLLPESGMKMTRKNKKNHDSNGTKNSGSGSQESGEGKLGKLLSSDKYQKKKSSAKQQEEQNEAPQESYTFSAVFNATTVRQRPRIGKKERDVVDMTNARRKKNEEDEVIGNDREDNAFIFFDPKARRR